MVSILYAESLKGLRGFESQIRYSLGWWGRLILTHDLNDKKEAAMGRPRGEHTDGRDLGLFEGRKVACVSGPGARGRAVGWEAVVREPVGQVSGFCFIPTRGGDLGGF